MVILFCLMVSKAMTSSIQLNVNNIYYTYHVMTVNVVANTYNIYIYIYM